MEIEPLDLIILILSTLSAGISATCLFLFSFDLIRQVQLAEKETNEDVVDEFKRIPILIRLVFPLTPNFIKFAKNPIFDSMRTNTRALLEQSGLDQACDPNAFIAARVILIIFGIVITVFLSLSGKLLLGLCFILLLGIYPSVWLKSYRDKRHRDIQRALPNMLDLLTLSVEAGKDFLTAMRDILRRRRRDPLGEELNRTFHEIQLGKSRRDALKGLSERVHQPDLTSVMNSVVQADELGVSIGQVLRIQGDQLRMKRFSRAETLANQAPVKILFPMVVFIFPAVFIILLAPILKSLFGTVL